MTVRPYIFAVIALLATTQATNAHVSERGLVLLLPTDIYIFFGVLAVLLTVFLTVLVPADLFWAVFQKSHAQALRPVIRGRNSVSLLSLAGFAVLIALGYFGPHDPLTNLLPLTLFTLWWICFPFLQALFGDIWAWVNPWSGAVSLVFGNRIRLHLPPYLGQWPAVVTYILAGVYTLTDIAPDDPSRLAVIAGIYWLTTFLLCGLFGPTWLQRGEGFTVFFTLIAKLSPFGLRPFRWVFPGQAILDTGIVGVSCTVFCVTILALGSFDGLNETFWWMARIGINPLEFPGRSAVVWPNRLGMLIAVVALNMIFAGVVWLGLVLIRQTAEFPRLFARLGLCLLPIALGYHAAHFLTSAMVSLQYIPQALNDPLHNGVRLLGLPDYYVTTSFFNQHRTVQQIWLTQAAAIVLAHMLAVILSHVIALQEFASHRPAVISQLPVSAFMVAYTFFGLWLLSSPVAL